MKQLIAVDWGTSSLRAALLDDRGRVLEETASERGTLSVAPGEFSAVLQSTCGHWMTAENKVLMSGMVGSRQGWMEAPYCPCPAGFSDIAARLTWINLDDDNRAAIVPGLQCEWHGIPDVMRGEETQVFGALDLLGLTEGLFVLPGTHSKWVRVTRGRIDGFSTFMTGEFYALLRQHSILARTLPPTDGELDDAVFGQGVQQARHCGNLMQAAFSARTLALFDRLPAAALPSYLSGLVIGDELHAQSLQGITQPVFIIGVEALTRRYEIGLAAFGIASRSIGTEATWRGLWALAQHLDKTS